MYEIVTLAKAKKAVSLSVLSLVLILAAVASVAIIGVSYIYLQPANSPGQVRFGSSWHYVGNTTEYFNDICPDSGLPVPCGAIVGSWFLP